MNVITVLPYGSKVQLITVDMHGYWGRDNHPEPTDIGFLGVVVGNFVSTFDAYGKLLVSRANVLGGTELVNDEDYSLADVCYKVRAADGRELELMNHEIEAI